MTDKLRCDWCKAFYKESEKYPHTCAFCGGPEPEPVVYKSPPFQFFYKDWWVVQERNMMEGTVHLRFYAGQDLQTEIEIKERDLYENVQIGFDIMPYIEKRLEEQGVTIPDTVWVRIQERRMSWLTN